MSHSSFRVADPDFQVGSLPSREIGFKNGGHAETWYVRGGKRLLDLFLIAILSPIVLPILVIVAPFVLLDGHAFLFKQSRVGRGGTQFKVFKIRTMMPDAEAALQSYLAKNPRAAEEWHKYQKLAHDPRITPIGRILRATSLDELPQLLNVLKGDMSLVGPRPMMPEQLDLYPGQHYTLMRPGITGPWQVSDRNASSFAERGRYDTEYWETMSFGNDLMLLWRTVGAVLSCSGR